jgi:hypothetical protein
MFVLQATLASLQPPAGVQPILPLRSRHAARAVNAHEPFHLLTACFLSRVSLPQASLANMRSELESSQSSLFEFTTRQEQAAGSASTAEQLAVEEVERLSADLLTLRKDKALLERQLQTLQQQQQSDGAGAGAGVNLTPLQQSMGGSADGADAAVADRQQQQRQQQESAAAEAALAAAEEAAGDQQHQIALLTTKLAAAEGRLERVTGELARRPAASAVAAMAEQLAALSALTGVAWCGVLGWGARLLWQRNQLRRRVGWKG